MLFPDTATKWGKVLDLLGMILLKVSNFAPRNEKGTCIMELPNDPMMLFSLINMKLRDTYPSLDALCKGMDIEKEDIVNRLKAAGFEYNEQQNKFW